MVWRIGSWYMPRLPSLIKGFLFFFVLNSSVGRDSLQHKYYVSTSYAPYRPLISSSACFSFWICFHSLCPTKNKLQGSSCLILELSLLEELLSPAIEPHLPGGSNSRFFGLATMSFTDSTTPTPLC